MEQQEVVITSSPEEVRQRLAFARNRLNDLETAKNGNLAAVDGDLRQQLFQEFFFHLTGAAEFLAQVVNSREGLIKEIHNVKVKVVSKKLPQSHPIKNIMCSLHPHIDKNNWPSDPYTDEGCHYRIIIYRNRITHNGNNPFHFYLKVGLGSKSYLFLDPRDLDKGRSEKEAFEEMENFYTLVSGKCEQVLGHYEEIA